MIKQFKMKKVFLPAVAIFFAIAAFAQQDVVRAGDEDQEANEAAEDYEWADDNEVPSFTYQHGEIQLSNGIATIHVPPGFKYLGEDEAEDVLVNYWGNPPYEGMTLGFLVPEDMDIWDADSYVFNIEYDDIGYVKDKDADKIDYDELLEQLQQETIEGNETREAEGYEPITLLGWASDPFYDKDRKILHWAKELRFGEDEPNTLNYSIRILGRKGVLILDAISLMHMLPRVQKDIPAVLDIVQFNDGFRYADFNPSIDEVAKWTIGGLVAGKILAKAGFLVVLLKLWKFIAIAAIAVFGFFARRFKKKKPNTDTELPVEAPLSEPTIAQPDTIEDYDDEDLEEEEDDDEDEYEDEEEEEKSR